MTGRRVCVAAFLLVWVVPVVILPGQWLPALFFGGFCLAGTAEWGRLCGLRGPGLWWYVWGALLLLALSGVLLVGDRLTWVLWPAALGWLVYAPCVLRRLPRSLWARLWLGWAVVLPGWGGLLYLHAEDRGMLAYLLVLVVAMDSVAYFAGRRWGRRRLAPTISPGKTWEGLVAAFAAALVVAAGYGMVDAVPLGLILAGVVAGLAGVLGDLLESAVKRNAGVKDSGRLLPGHGGVLDRIDSLCAAAPVYAAGVLIHDIVV